MNALVAQLPALLGVLFGAVTSYVATTTAERGRWRRNQAVRWDERRLAAYSEYAHAVKKVMSLAVRVREAPEGADIGPAELDEAEEERTMRWEAVLLLGTDETITAGRTWHQSVYILQRLATGLPASRTWADAVADAGRARRDFYRTAKRDLGLRVDGGRLSAYEWQLGKFDPTPDAPSEAPDAAPAPR